jgi:hypothetical protein
MDDAIFFTVVEWIDDTSERNEGRRKWWLFNYGYNGRQ